MRDNRFLKRLRNKAKKGLREAVFLGVTKMRFVRQGLTANGDEPFTG